MKHERRRLLKGMFACGVALSFGVASAGDHTNVLHLQNGKIFINNQRQSGTYSALMTNFRYLYFYVPGQGLFVISNSQFGWAVEAGRFEDRELWFDVSGIQFKLVASRPILGKTSQPLWVYYDRGFTLDVKSIMFGYGDSESAPYDWPNQVGKHN